MEDKEKVEHGKPQEKETVHGDGIIKRHALDGDSLIPEIPKDQIPNPPKEEEGKKDK